MKKVEIFENERAQGYNQFVETWIPNYNYFLECLPKLLRDTHPKNLLSVGCGTGNEIEYFVKASEEWKITGVDPSPEMIKQAKARFGDCKNVTLIEGLISELNPENRYSVATILLVLHFFEDNGDKLNILKSIADKLDSGATLIILDINGSKTQIKQNLEILKFLLPRHLSEEQIFSRLKRIENELCFVSEERLSKLCQEAGFNKPFRFFQ